MSLQAVKEVMSSSRSLYENDNHCVFVIDCSCDPFRIYRSRIRSFVESRRRLGLYPWLTRNCLHRFDSSLFILRHDRLRAHRVYIHFACEFDSHCRLRAWRSRPTEPAPSKPRGVFAQTMHPWGSKEEMDSQIPGVY